MFKKLTNIFTKNKTQIPLFYVSFDYQYFQEHGKINSCKLVAHPLLRNDTHIKESLNGIIDYIRDEYNVEEL